MVQLASKGSFIYYILVILSFLFVVLINAIPGYIGKFAMLIIALLLDVLAFSMRFYSYFFIPMLKMKNRTVVLNNDVPFIMSPSGNAIVVKKGEEYYASSFVKIPIYRSSTEMSSDEKLEFAKSFSRIVSMNSNIMKLVSQLYIINKDEYIANIRTKLNEAEDKYQRVMSGKSSPSEIERAKGEMTMWHNLYDNISNAQSRDLIAYAMVTASGSTEEEATNLALQRAEEAAVGIGSILGISATIAKGEEILVLIEPEYAVPVSTVSEALRQKTIEAGL